MGLVSPTNKGSDGAQELGSIGKRRLRHARRPARGASRLCSCGAVTHTSWVQCLKCAVKWFLVHSPCCAAGPTDSRVFALPERSHHCSKPPPPLLLALRAASSHSVRPLPGSRAHGVWLCPQCSWLVHVVFHFVPFVAKCCSTLRANHAASGGGLLGTPPSRVCVDVCLPFSRVCAWEWGGQVTGSVSSFLTGFHSSCTT